MRESYQGLALDFLGLRGLRWHQWGGPGQRHFRCDGQKWPGKTVSLWGAFLCPAGYASVTLGLVVSWGETAFEEELPFVKLLFHLPAESTWGTACSKTHPVCQVNTKKQANGLCFMSVTQNTTLERETDRKALLAWRWGSPSPHGRWTPDIWPCPRTAVKAFQC